MDEAVIAGRIAQELTVKPAQVIATIGLIKEGCTVPFISRYRKEVTGNLDEVQVRDVSHRLSSYTNLETRRIEIIRGIFAQGKLTEDLLRNLQKCRSLTELEDIYAPFKKKKKTRGMIAREKGLEPLAQIICRDREDEVIRQAAAFVAVNTENPELSVSTAEEAVQGAEDIIAEDISQDVDARSLVKSFYLKTGRLVVKGIGGEEKKTTSTYAMYWDYAEPLSTLKPHRVLAVNRGEREGELEVKIETDEAAAVSLVQGRYEMHN